MFTNSGYKIITTEYAERHFIKAFKKKYKTLWNETYLTIEVMLSHIERFLNTSKVERIHISDNCYIAKCEFKIAGSNESPKTSGNRIIIYVDENKKKFRFYYFIPKQIFNDEMKRFGGKNWGKKIIKKFILYLIIRYKNSILF